MISTPISNGFGGLTSSLLESLRDEFAKSKIFTTAMMENSDSWNRADTEVCPLLFLSSSFSDSVRWVEVDQSTPAERGVEHDFARGIIVDAPSDSSANSLE